MLIGGGVNAINQYFALNNITRIIIDCTYKIYKTLSWYGLEVRGSIAPT